MLPLVAGRRTDTYHLYIVQSDSIYIRPKNISDFDPAKVGSRVSSSNNWVPYIYIQTVSTVNEFDPATTGSHVPFSNNWVLYTDIAFTFFSKECIIE